MLQRTIENYPGSKGGAGTYHCIINQIPPIKIYIEPFAGGAAVAHHLSPAALTVINDIDGSVMQRYVKANFPAVLTNLDYKSCIVKYANAGPQCLVFADPPYLLSTRRSQRTLYNFEWLESDHLDFLKYITSINCLVIISHYPCDLYDNVLHAWRQVDYNSMTRGGLRRERLYINYPEPEKLHDYRYLGDDFQKRQGIKRKIKRLEMKLAMLPAVERSALIKSLVSKYGNG